MRKPVAILVLVSALSLSTLPLHSLYAQRKPAKTATATPAAVAKQRGVDQINEAQLRAFLTFISADEMEGRDTPSRGLDTTAKFIAMNLTRWGFKPAGDDGSYLQHIALRRDHLDAATTQVELNGQKQVIGDDYIPTATPGNVSGQLVFAGSGWYVKSKNLDAYRDLDAKGKIAVIFVAPNSLPHGVRFSDLGKQGEDWLNPVDNARKHGVAGLVYVPDFQFFANWERNRARFMERGATVVEKFIKASGQPVPTIIASAKFAGALFQSERRGANSLFEETLIGGEGVTAPFVLNADKKVSINVGVKNETAGTQNVVAVWEGSDPVLKDEYVALGAHYDHVGICAPGAADQICNGADDDGSGTTALLAMAEALARATTRPKRSVLFVWHCGEEKGLWGSQYFTENPTIPLDRIVTQLNIDMIGRSKKEGDTNPRNRTLTGPNDIYVIGHALMSTELGELSEAVNKAYLNLGYDFRYDDPQDPNRFFFRSDHYNYARKGIPIIFFFDGEHEDYHRPSDEVQKIDFPKMEKVARTIYVTMWEIANRATRPKVDKGVPAQVRGRQQ